jgi:DNA-binding response OmpR family regulator
MTHVLLLGKDWQFRALLRAQLIEEGLEAKAYETVRAALASLEETDLLPAMLVVDLFASDDPAADIEQLATWASQIPIWIVASRNLMAEKRLKGRGFEVILFRPVDMGELVEQIKQRLER